MTSIGPRYGWKLFLVTLLLLCGPTQFHAGSLICNPSNPNGTSLPRFALAINDATNVIQEPAAGSRRPSASQPPQDLTQAKAKADAAFAAGERLRKEDSAKLFKRAIEKYGEALLLYRATGSRSDEAKTLTYIGIAYKSLYNNRRALDFFNQALTVFRDLGDRAGEATTLTGIGAAYDSLGEKQQALEFLSQALPIQEGVGDRAAEANTLNQLGTLYQSLGQRQKAIKHLHEALQLRRAVKDLRGEAETLNDIGEVHHSLGEIQKARESFNAALLICRSVASRSGEARALSNIGAVYNSLGEKQEALKTFDRALLLYKATGDRAGEAATLNDMGVAYYSLRFNFLALAFFNNALRIYRAIADRNNEARTLDNIGSVYLMGLPRFSNLIEYRSGEWKTLYDDRKKALRFYIQALRLRRAVGDRGGEAITLGNIGFVYASLRDRQRALQFYSEALPLFREVRDRAGEATTSHNLMFFWTSDNGALAVFFGKQAVNALQQLRENISGLEKGLQRTFLRSKESTYRMLASLLISQGRLPEAQHVLGLLKEEEYFDFVRRDAEAASLTSARISFTSAETELEKRYSEITDRIAKIGAEHSEMLAIKERTPEQEKRLSELEAHQQIARQVFQKFLDQLRAELKLNPRETVATRDLQVLKGTLRELNAVALYTIVGQEKYYLILITPDVEKAFEYKISEAELNKKVFAFRKVLSDPAADPLPLAQELYRILIGPELARDIVQTTKQTILWSLDGALRYLPMSALHDGNKYLVESYRNVMITLASREHLKDPVSPNWKVLGLGVSKGSVVDTGSNSSLTFRPLPGVLKELAGIVRDETNVGGVLPGTVLLDEGFTAEAMKAALRLRGNEQEFKLVHIASHFLFEPGDETKSFLLMGGGKRLTLAELNSMSQIFSRVELLTLSACDTAMGGEGAAGNEVEGFAVLAQRQGAEAIIASLWPVSDPSTSELMRQFYLLRGEHPGMSKAEAIRQAQLSLLRPEEERAAIDKEKKRNLESPYRVDPRVPYAHPYFWAPFILIGNWR